MLDSSTPLPVDQTLELDQINRSEFVTAMAHLYRGELAEATAGRDRIDTTFNWAIVMSATTLIFVFDDKAIERHVLIPIITLFCTFMLNMEARRYPLGQSPGQASTGRTSRALGIPAPGGSLRSVA